MKFIKKILFWTTFWTGILLIFVLVISLLLPHIISPEYLRSKIIEQVSLRIGYNINLQHVDIIIFPRLHADIRNATVSVPGNFSVNINSIKAYPEIWPLLTGNVNIYKLYLDDPNIKVYIPERLSEETDLLKYDIFRNVDKQLHDFFKSRTLEKTDIVVHIRNGNVALYTGKRLYFNFRSIFSRVKLKPKFVEIALNAKSNICDNISINGQFFSDNSKGKGDIKLYNLNPKLLFAYLYPDSDLKIADSKVDIKVNLSKKGVLNFNSKFEGEIPLLSLKRNNENLILNSRHFSGNINICGDRTAINIEKLIIDNTESILSGNYVVNAPYSPAQLDLEGKNIDIKETGRIALFFTGNSHTFQSIFNVLKEGKVPSINITAKAPQASELGDIKNIFIRGRALNAKISVPEPSLELEDIKGDVTVSGGILVGNNLECRLGNSFGQNATFKLGLSEDNNLLYLDAFVRADLSPLPSILKQVVKNKSFLNELSLIKQCKGKAEGRLTIDDRAGSCSTKVDVSKFDMKGVYSRFSNPIAVIGNKFFMDDSVLKFMLVNTASGRSSVSNLSAEFRFDKDSSFKIVSGKTTIDAKEINLFAPYFQSGKIAAENINIHKGTAILYNTGIKGPLFTPDKWRFTTAGKIENMLVDYKSVFKEPLNITTLNFNASQSFTGKDIRQNKYKIEDGYISSGKSRMTINGDIDLSKEESLLDMSAFSDSLCWSDIKKLINQPIIKSNAKTEKSRSSSVKGIIRTHIANFIYDDYTLSPFKADILFEPNKISIAILKADICGISLTGTLDASQSKVEFKIKPFAKDQELASSLKCFWNDTHFATGIFNLDGKIYSKGEEKEISKLLYGTLEFNAGKGRIHRLGFLSKIFALLNVAEIFRGKLPDLIGEGFAYNTITIEGKFEKGNFVVSKFIIDGASMAIVCTGNIDIGNNRADIIVLISPFKTFDLIIKYIPVVTQILGGNIITIPFRVLGKLEDPDVIPLSPTAVGSGLLKMLQRTIALPVKIIQPLSSGKDTVNKDEVISGR